MTEKEKMLKKLLYDANYDIELINERITAKDLCHQYNLLYPSYEQNRQKILKQLLGKTEGSFYIIAPFWCDYGYNIEIGENFFANHNTIILDAAKVKFGNNVFVAPNCGFYTAGHPIDYERRNKGLEYAYPITIGDNVWIGVGAIVSNRVSVGTNARVSIGAVATKNVPDEMTVSGNFAIEHHRFLENLKKSIQE